MGAHALDPTAARATTRNRSARALLSVGVLTAAVGGVLLVTALVTSAGAGRRAFEALFAAEIVVAGVLAALPWGRATRGRSLLLGGAVLGGALLYLGTAMPSAGRASYSEGVTQFAGVLGALVLGGLLLAVSAPAGAGGDERGEGAWARVAREGLLLVVGTILLAIGSGQLARSGLMPPKWNWTSFLGITVPGMLVLVVARGAVKSAVRRSAPRSPSRAVGILATEVLLVAGLGVMLYGSFTNLNLGANGYEVGLKGNDAGLALWAGAAAFLVVVRGGLKLAAPDRGRRRTVALQALYAVGVLAFIYGERAVLMGKDPALTFGAALPAAAAIVAAGIALLVAGRGTVLAAADRQPVARTGALST